MDDNCLAPIKTVLKLTLVYLNVKLPLGTAIVC